jgi:hypothetical protein
VKLRDHVARLAIARSSANLSAEEAAAHRANLSASGGEAYIEQCMTARSPAFVACALAAMTIDELGRCDDQ